MMFKRRSSNVIWLLALVTSGLVAACGGGGAGNGGGGTPPATGFAQTYTTSAAAGEVIQFGIDTTAMTYSYKITQSGYGYAGKTSTGTLTSKNPEGSYNLSASADNFIQGGVLFPIQNGLLTGQVHVNLGSGNQKIPVFGVSTPITAIANLAGTYNFVASKCSAPSAGVSTGCTSQYGTVKITNTNATTDAMTVCVGIDITATPTCSTFAGTVTASADAGIYSFTRTGAPTPTASFIAFTAPNGQNVAVVDFNDTGLPLYGQAVASSQASLTAGSTDGAYFLKNNVGGGALITITGTTFTDSTNFWPLNSTTHVTGTITYNSPWAGLVSFSRSDANNGVAIQAGTGAFAAMLTASPNFPGLSNYFYEVGMKY